MPYKDGVFVEPMNADRAEFARASLLAYAEQTWHNPADHDLSVSEAFEEILGDLLCDLRHLRDQLGHGTDIGLLDFDASITYQEREGGGAVRTRLVSGEHNDPRRLPRILGQDNSWSSCSKGPPFARNPSAPASIASLPARSSAE
jgi:hypothetical protein